jgi:enamine deaminase RidA (YjgF/YER057c/UK114 family)
MGDSRSADSECAVIPNLTIGLINWRYAQMAEEVIQNNLRRLGIALPLVPAPLANYVPSVIAGNLLFLSGQGPKSAIGGLLAGKVGEDVTPDEAYQHARLIGISMLAAIQSAVGSLDRVSRVVKILGFVNAGPAFRSHPKVINGCSDLMVEVFGEKGRHARSAIGVHSLPEGITVEIEGIFEIRQP